MITGGLGDLGLALAEWMIKQGASHLVLLGRREPDAALLAKLAHLRRSCRIDLMRIDLGNKEAVDACIAACQTHLKGIFHLAGVLLNATIADQRPDYFHASLLPKMIGAIHLCQACLNHQVSLDYFVNYSSIASVFGSHGQSHYAAANSFLDAFSAWCRTQGLSAQTIQWGNWAEIGMVREQVAKHKARGWLAMSPKQALKTMGMALQQHDDRLIANIDWPLLLPYLPKSPRFAHFDKPVVADTFMTRLYRLPEAQRYSAIQNLLVDEVRLLAGMDAQAELDLDKGFFNLGLDSLMTVDLRKRLQLALGEQFTLYPTVLFDYPNIRKLSDYLADLLQIQSGKQAHITTSQSTKEPIAIIGMSGIFPGADTTDAFWSLLCEGRDGVSEVPAERWDLGQYYDASPDAPGKMISRRGGFIHGIEQFDANFFNISPREADYLDPQQRLLLEHTWQALESANIPPESLKGTPAGVFIGMSMHDYDNLLVKQQDLTHGNAYITSGNSFSTAAGRLSYTFGLEGPCMVIDTACSSSLVALNEACNRLQQGECHLAIVGGANVLLNPDTNIHISKANMLSPDGKCKTFDEKADGYVRSEGCAIVILK
ncbi:MAG: SDR family NAD(P)-dependent oxidoreductase, partial [Prosthecobacter sp.]|nr:SDR family NAD(P)-dependent oxidoreductase [Prosthecobacter sp.]